MSYAERRCRDCGDKYMAKQVVSKYGIPTFTKHGCWLQKKQKQKTKTRKWWRMW